MGLLFDWSDVINPARREILFEHRNKSYGAYDIRKNYRKNIWAAFLITIVTAGALILIPVISGFLRTVTGEKKMITESVMLGEPPPIDKNAPPPPPPVEESPPPVRQTIKFTPPVVVQDEDAEAPPTQDEVKKGQVSTVTQEGEDIADLPPDPAANPNEDDQIFTIVEEMPSFPGGDKKLTELLSRIVYPKIARESGIAGSVYLSFVVEKDGKIKDAKVLKGIGGGCDEEALRVLNSLPDWIPGKQNGRPVAVRSSVRVNFTLR